MANLINIIIMTNIKIDKLLTKEKIARHIDEWKQIIN